MKREEMREGGRRKEEGREEKKGYRKRERVKGVTLGGALLSCFGFLQRKRSMLWGAILMVLSISSI